MTEIRKKKWGGYEELVYGVLTYAMLILLTLFVLVPFYVIVITSFREQYDAMFNGFRF